MPMLEIDGFIVESVTTQPSPAVPHFDPAIRVSNPETGFTETTSFVTQDIERLSQRAAQQWADSYLAGIDFIGPLGELPRN